MIYAVFLCDKKWEIKKIKECSPKLPLKEGDNLAALVTEADLNREEEQYSLELTFSEQKLTLAAIIHSYREGNLVVLAQVSGSRDFLEFQNAYPEYREWAEDHIYGLFRSEYYMIQQMNNRLVDAQRQLTRSNRKLEHALQENREINKKLDEARKYAEHASNAKTNFLASMSHDIRTPMNAIVGLAELMQHNLDQPDILNGYITKLRSSSQYLLDLINDILDLTKIENGSVELKTEPMDLGAQIEQIVTIIRPQLTKKNLNLSVHGEDATFGYLMGDPVRFRQVLMNVFSNAIKYTPEGGNISFTIRETAGEEQERNYQFIIEDNGMGMSREFLQHIFDPFSRAEAAVKEIQGTGLGMAITKNIVDAMEGTITVTSDLGKGSRFDITLPFAPCEDAVSASDQAASLGDGQADSGTGLTSLKGMRFLCAEDNELNAEILIALLELEGAECTVYENGKLIAEAFETVAPGEYDAILMDVQMPVMNGYEATEQIRNSKNPLGRTIPIIAMTANAFQEDRERSVQAGMNAHISKPIDMKVLRNVMDKVKNREY